MVHRPQAAKTPFQAPLRLAWTGEKLLNLSQEQLLNLLHNLDSQKAIGRVSEVDAEAIELEIQGLLSRTNARRRKQALAALAQAAQADKDDQAA